jgi:hypothetical protein
MRRTKLLIAAALAGLAAWPAAAGPAGAPFTGLRDAAAPRAQLVWWHAGGVTPGGTAWHAGGAGGARWGGAYHPPYGYHTAVGGYGGVHYGGYYRAPVPVAPWYHPAGAVAAGAAAGAVVGGLAGAAAASSVAQYAQPPTVVNNYYD